MAPHRINLLSRSDSENGDPLIPLYLIFGIIGGVLLLLIVAVTLLLGGSCCCYQARKLFTVFADNRRRTVDDENHAYRYNYGDRYNSVSHVARPQSVAARPIGFILDEIPSDRDNTAISAADSRRLSFSQDRQRLLLLPPPPALSHSNSRRPSRARSSRRLDGYSSRSRARNQSHSPKLFSREGSKSERQGRYHGLEDRHTARSRQRHENRKRTPGSSRERSERRASRPDQYASLSSDGRPGLASY